MLFLSDKNIGKSIYFVPNNQNIEKFYLMSIIGSHLFERRMRSLGVKMDSKIKPLFHLQHKKRKKV